MSDSPANVALPPGACDCHVHVFEERWPLAPTALSTPPDAPVAEYRTVQQALGLSRVVVVQPTAYGLDNRCTLDALAQWGSAARGVAVVDANVDDADLQQLHDAGIRGARFQMLPGGALPWESLEPVAERIRPLGWHIDLQMDGARFPELEERLARLQVPLVVITTASSFARRRRMPPRSRRCGACSTAGVAGSSCRRPTRPRAPALPPMRT